MTLSVTSSPHIRSNVTTRRLMGDVLIALLPALAAGVWAFGVRALAVCCLTMAVCAATELLASLAMKKPAEANLSALVTGLLLAMTLPATVPYWVAAIGGVFAILAAKLLCGGLGRNLLNPALTARALLMLFFPRDLTRFTAPGTALPFGSAVDVVTSATPMHTMQMPAIPEQSLLDMFLGRIPGCIGEVSAIALLLGGIYLIARHVISARTPLAYIGTVALLTLVFHKGQPAGIWMLYEVLGGGLLLGAIFMATDYATSPTAPRAQIAFGIGCGALTVLFRYFGLFPEGVTYAILLMNGLAWTFDRFLPPYRYGSALKGGCNR